MIFAALTWRGGGEQHDWRMSDEIGHEGRGARRRQMLGDLQTLGDIKATSKTERRRQVMDDKACRIDFKLAAIHIVAINSEDVMDGLRAPFPQPGSARATDVKDALYGENGPDRGNDATSHGDSPEGCGSETECT